MKRRKLLKYLERHACVFLREGRRHTIYQRSGTDHQTAIPRHPEIVANLVKKICKDLGIPTPLEK
jgi:mRNA interferase HicA